jgi:carbonic anhydrase/acetyltransferase-like protein (isoleucine patch superfamily)
MGAIVLDAAKIGENCIIGAGTLIPGGKVIPPGSLVMGNPYRIVRDVTQEDLQHSAQGVAHYVEQIKSYVKTGIIR